MAIVFGVFDGLHPGHLYFLYHASNGDPHQLTAVVTPDSVARRYKGHDPERPTQEARCAAIRKLGYNAALGDEREGTYSAVRSSNKSTVIFIGYDQKGLQIDLHRRMLQGELPSRKIHVLSDYCGTKFHTSILRRKKHRMILRYLVFRVENTKTKKKENLIKAITI